MTRGRLLKEHAGPRSTETFPRHEETTSQGLDPGGLSLTQSLLPSPENR
jgi:hypothetical protein